MVPMIGSMMVDHEESPVLKHALWATSMAGMALGLSPITLMGGQLVLKAATGTAMIVGALSAVASAAPSDAFLQNAGMLSVGLGVQWVSRSGSLPGMAFDDDDDSSADENRPMAALLYGVAFLSSMLALNVATGAGHGGVPLMGLPTCESCGPSTPTPPRVRRPFPSSRERRRGAGARDRPRRGAPLAPGRDEGLAATSRPAP